MEENLKEHDSEKSLAIPTFEVDKNTAFMLHNSKDLTPIQTHLLSELNILNQKSDWTMNILADMHGNLTKQIERVNGIEDWKYGMEEWKVLTNKKLNNVNDVVDDIKDKKEKVKFLNSCFTYLLSGLISAASAFAALWFIIEKLGMFDK